MPEVASKPGEERQRPPWPAGLPGRPVVSRPGRSLLQWKLEQSQLTELPLFFHFFWSRRLKILTSQLRRTAVTSSTVTTASSPAQHFGFDGPQRTRHLRRLRLPLALVLDFLCPSQLQQQSSTALQSPRSFDASTTTRHALLAANRLWSITADCMQTLSFHSRSALITAAAQHTF